MSGFRPLHDRVLVRRVEADGARDETGRVVPLDVKVGDRVLFGKWADRRRRAAHSQGIGHSRHDRR
jgi:co-chaperonin GroES (HSP10)